jgi:uncharacterized protein (DUF305 family)
MYPLLLGRLARPTSWFAAVLAALSFSALAAAPAPDKKTALYEIDFMEDMIDHHAMAVQMATFCEQRAVHEELRSLCTQIRESQSEEIAMMQSWLFSWYGDSYQPEMSNSGMRHMDRLASLSGAEFEVAFMEMMIRHHEKAIKEATTCLSRAYHPELLNLCQNIIDTQTREIRQMRAWLCEWYGMCGGRKS